MISECMILTAAHCLVGRKIEELLVVVGDTQRFVKNLARKHTQLNKCSYIRNMMQSLLIETSLC